MKDSFDVTQQTPIFAQVANALAETCSNGSVATVQGKGSSAIPTRF
jgi:hypothetical protein